MNQFRETFSPKSPSRLSPVDEILLLPCQDIKDKTKTSWTERRTENVKTVYPPQTQLECNDHFKMHQMDLSNTWEKLKRENNRLLTNRFGLELGFPALQDYFTNLQQNQYSGTLITMPLKLLVHHQDDSPSER